MKIFVFQYEDQVVAINAMTVRQAKDHVWAALKIKAPGGGWWCEADKAGRHTRSFTWHKHQSDAPDLKKRTFLFHRNGA